MEIANEIYAGTASAGVAAFELEGAYYVNIDLSTGKEQIECANRMRAETLARTIRIAIEDAIASSVKAQVRVANLIERNWRA